jgi:hypothetical protein
MRQEAFLFYEMSIRHGLEARATGLPIFSAIMHLAAIQGIANILSEQYLSTPTAIS